MIDFQQIIAWITSMSELVGKLPPILDRIKSGVKKKKLDGIEFIEPNFGDSALSNIQQLNEVLKQNGLEEIDESLLDVQTIDIEAIVQQMQNSFTEQELADAIEGPLNIVAPTEISNLDLDLAELCDPQVVEQSQEFSEKELVDAACLPSPDTDQGVSSAVSDIPSISPEITADLDQDSVPNADDKIFDKLKEIGGTPNPENGLDCIKRMQEVSNSIQAKVEEYTKAKQEIQEIQLDYFYNAIANAYYQSFLQGYGEINQLRKEKSDLSGSNTQYAAERKKEIEERLKSLPSEFSQVRDRSDMQDKMEQVILSFSNQFEINIGSAFLGLIKPVPTVIIDKKIVPLEGKVKEIPDEFLKFLDSTSKEDPAASDLITKEAKKNEEKLNAEFTKTVSDVSYFSFGFGLNQFLQNESIETEFNDISKAQNEEYLKVEKRYNELKQKEKQAQDAIDSINKQIMEELTKLNCESKEIPAKEEPGKNLNFKNVSKNPTIFDYAWWVKFSKLATIVNLVPVHWPVGLLIPTPSGLIKIPFPIIWIPLFVAPTDKLIAVIFIGQCGILPCPFIFLHHFLPIPIGPFESNNPYFALAIRGGINISNHDPLPPSSIPSFDPIFTMLNAALESVRNGIPMDFNQLVEEVKRKLKDVERQATQYLVNIDQQANDIIKNAKAQALASVNSMKETMQLTIKQAQQEGARLIKQAQDTYKNAANLGEIELQIQRNVDSKIKEAQQLYESATELANRTIKDAEEQALGLKKRAEDTIDGIIKQGKAEYEARLSQIEELESRYEKTLETLRDLINKIKTPTIDLSLLKLSPIFQAFSMTLGSLQSLAAMFSPKAIQFGFPTEIDPKFSASLPILKDELPPWERLSLLNIPFVLFLWKWCKAGKEKGGFFRDAI